MKFWQVCLIALALSGLPVTLNAQSFPSSPYIKMPQPLPAPELSWQNEHGETRTLADYQGNVVILNFWATWCAPCVIELPHLEKLQRRYGAAGLRVVALSTDVEGPKTVQSFLAQRNLRRLEVANNPSQAILTPFQVRALPVSFVIDADGNMIGTVQGFSEWNGEALEHIALALQSRANQLEAAPFDTRRVMAVDENDLVGGIRR